MAFLCKHLKNKLFFIPGPLYYLLLPLSGALEDAIIDLVLLPRTRIAEKVRKGGGFHCFLPIEDSHSVNNSLGFKRLRQSRRSIFFGYVVVNHIDIGLIGPVTVVHFFEQ